MAHWAELNENNIVLRVLFMNNDDPNGDEGYQWLIDNLGGRWVKTSYNAYRGKRKNPDGEGLINEPGFRKNYACIGYSYNEDIDAFVPPKPEVGTWELDPEVGDWYET